VNLMPGLDNELLAVLPRADFALIEAHLETVSFEQGHLLIEAGDEVDRVYFPHAGMISLLTVTRDGRAIETSTVGRDGVVGAMAGLGLHTALVRAVVQMPLTLSHISAKHFRKAVAGSEALRDLAIRYNEVLLAQAQITAGCNALHGLEARFCRWVLQVRDHSASDTIPLTQEFLAQMLGVRRTSVTEVAQKLQAAGVIHYRRGFIDISDRRALEALACECHDAISRARALLLAQKR
jgi:CRP-like cAMP-binding protein